MSSLSSVGVVSATTTFLDDISWLLSIRPFNILIATPYSGSGTFANVAFDIRASLVIFVVEIPVVKVV